MLSPESRSLIFSHSYKTYGKIVVFASWCLGIRKIGEFIDVPTAHSHEAYN
jgi:hypothetical protein